MLRLFAARCVAWSLCVVGSLGAAGACSAGKGSEGIGDGGGGASGASGASAQGGSGAVIGGTGGAVVTGGTGATGTGGGPECAGDLVMGQPVPVDVYVMLDISGSMLAATGSGTKWDAVKAALATFLNDPQSAGLGVAIQYFPLQAPGVPPMCAASADCGANGPCLLKACALYLADTALPPGPGFAQCEVDADCASPLVKDDGPCEMGQCRLSGATCTDAASCQAHATNVGPCITLGHCQNNANLLCEAGTLCSAMNPCVAATTGSCVHETLCDQNSYALPAVEFGALPGAAGALITSIDAQAPRGETPSRPALRGAIDHARAWATSHPGHSVVAVLATDGLPTDCSGGNAVSSSSSDAEVNEVIAVAAEGLAASPNISTFVVGVFAASDTAAPANLNRIAMAGGTNQAFVIDASSSTVNTQFVAALNAIRTSRLGCEFQIPAPPVGQMLNYGLVNVVLSDSAGVPTDLPRVVGGVDRCAEVGGGWYYDPDPMVGTPTRIIACPSTCGTLTSTIGGSVQIKLGCRTVER